MTRVEPKVVGWCFRGADAFYVPDDPDGECPSCNYDNWVEDHNLEPRLTWVCPDCEDGWGFLDEQEYYEHMEEYHSEC